MSHIPADQISIAMLQHTQMCVRWVCIQYTFACVSGCVRMRNMTYEGVISIAVPKPFPADTGVLSKVTPDFLSSGMGDRIPGAGWLHPPEVYWQGSLIGGRMETHAHLFSPLWKGWGCNIGCK